MPHPKYTNLAIWWRAEDLYEERIRAEVEAENDGRYLAIDIETGEYEIGDDMLDLSHRLHARLPDAVLYLKRIGYSAVGSLGGGWANARGPDANDIVRRFVNAINRHDVEALFALMTDDHAFIDALGRRLEGRDTLRDAWRAYFAAFPDYRMTVEELLQDGPAIVGLFGHARATPAAPPGDENRFDVPAAWKAVVRDSLIAEWRVYADTRRFSHV